LRWAEVDLAAGVCSPTHYQTTGRTALARVLYLTQPAKEIIGAIDRSGEFVFKSRLGRQYKPSSLRSILYKRGVTGGVYALRHTFAQAALATARMEVVSRLLGHADLRMVNVYAQVRDRQALEAVATLPSPLSYASDGDQPS
jgi:integrase